jgi:hypothetical protein
MGAVVCVARLQVKMYCDATDCPPYETRAASFSNVKFLVKTLPNTEYFSLFSVFLYKLYTCCVSFFMFNTTR